MRPSNWTPERDKLLRELRASDTPRPEMLARINEGFEPKVRLTQMVERARTIGAKRGEPVPSHENYTTAGPRYRRDDEYRAMSNAFARAHRTAGIRFRVVRFASSPRQGIMSGKPPDHAEMVAARVAQSRQARGGVGLAFVRGLE